MEGPCSSPFEFGPSGERIVPASQNTGGSGVTINQVVNIDSRTDQAAIMQAMEAAKDRAKAEIREETWRRGGVLV